MSIFLGHWYPCFGLLVMSPLGFKARMGSLIHTWQRCMSYTFPDSPLVQDLLTTWQPAWQPVTSFSRGRMPDLDWNTIPLVQKSNMLTIWPQWPGWSLIIYKWIPKDAPCILVKLRLNWVETHRVHSGVNIAVTQSDIHGSSRHSLSLYHHNLHWYYRSGTVNSKSFVGKENGDWTKVCNSSFHQNFELEFTLD